MQVIDAPGRHVALGSKSFVAILSMCMAVTALGVDTILPAFGEIRTAFDLSSDATQVTGLVTFYLMGNALGLLPAGLLADRFGRRAVMWGGLALYIGGAVASVLAPTLGFMIVARFVCGLGGAGPRVGALAMVRDGFAGEQMAKQMSTMMAVFLLIPAVAPSLSAGVLAVAPWQAVLWLTAVAAAVVAAVVGRLPETLPVTSRRTLAARSVGAGIRQVLSTPGTVWYLVSLTSLFGVFMAYLSGSELIIDQTFGLADWFPVFFGGLALVMLLAMVINGRVVERVGLPRLLKGVFIGNTASVTTLLVVSLATGGTPPFWLFVVLISMVLLFQQALIPNLNAAAMRPLAQVAGTGAAILGMVPGAVGAAIGEFINRRFDGTITPLAIGFVIASVASSMAWHTAERAAVRG